MYLLFVFYLFMMDTTLSLASYNSNGHGCGRFEYINKLMKCNDIVLVQEHWLFENEITIFQNKIDDILVHGISSMDNRQLLIGRPHGGCAIIWKKNLQCQITPINCNSKRLCAVIVKMNGMILLLVNLYMPCDTSVDNSNEFECVLNEMSTLIVNHNVDHIIIGGDFNADLSRSTSLHVEKLLMFVEKENLKCALSYEGSHVNFTYESKISGNRSTIDHFILSENLFDMISVYESIHDGDNLSDHCALNVTLNIPVVYSDELTKCKTAQIDWKNAKQQNILDYKEELDDNLSRICIPWQALKCKNLYCKEHNVDLEFFLTSIVNSYMVAINKCIPSFK